MVAADLADFAAGVDGLNFIKISGAMYDKEPLAPSVFDSLDILDGCKQIHQYGNRWNT